MLFIFFPVESNNLCFKWTLNEYKRGSHINTYMCAQYSVTEEQYTVREAHIHTKNYFIDIHAIEITFTFSFRRLPRFLSIDSIHHIYLFVHLTQNVMWGVWARVYGCCVSVHLLFAIKTKMMSIPNERKTEKRSEFIYDRTTIERFWIFIWIFVMHSTHS